MKYLVSIFVYFLLIAPIWAQLSNASIDILHYRFELLLSDMSNNIVGKTDVRAKLLAERDNISLNLRTYSSDGKGMQVIGVRANDKIVEYKQKEDDLKIFFSKKIPKGETVQLQINYKGIPADGLIISKNKLGDDIFWQGIKTYYQKYQHSNATTEDLQSVMESVSGQNLEQFFKQWCYEAAYPIVDIDWTYDSKKGSVSFHIKQTQKGALFELDIPVAIYSQSDSLLLQSVLKVNKPEQTREIKVKSVPNRVISDSESVLLGLIIIN